MKLTVKAARVRVNKNQQDVADALQMHVQTYANLEKHPDKFTIGQAVKFCEYVSCDMSDILFLPDNSN